MESPPEPVTVPDKSASAAGASLEDSPVKLEGKAETDKPAPVRRQSCSSTNKVECYCSVDGRNWLQVHPIKPGRLLSSASNGQSVQRS
ncbi:putative RAR-related orphan receptor A, partial [Triplophysa rosa]